MASTERQKTDPIRVRWPALTLYQREHLFHDARTVIVEASTKSGKTLGCIIWQGERVLMDLAGLDHWWVAPIYAQARIAYRRVKRMLPREIYTSNDSDNRLTFVNGARWWFKSAENPDGLFGEDVASIVIDEASRMREDSYFALRTTLTATGGPMRIIGNVKGRRNWAWRMARKAEAGAPDMHYARITAHDAIEAGLFSEAELRAAEGDLPEHIFRELYFAEASDDEGNPFGIDAIRACIAPLSSEPVRDWGGDLAKSVDWSVLIGLDAAGAVAHLDRFQKPWGQTTAIFSEKIGFDRAFIDSTGVGDPVVETLQKTASNITGYKFTGPSKQQLMEGLSVAIQRQEVTYPDGVIVAELEAFEYIYSRTGVKYSAPEGLHDDAVMALALAIACRNSRKAPWAPALMDGADAPTAPQAEAEERTMADDGFIPMGTA